MEELGSLPLAPELWIEIFRIISSDADARNTVVGLCSVCRRFQELAEPFIYDTLTWFLQDAEITPSRAAIAESTDVAYPFKQLQRNFLATPGRTGYVKTMRCVGLSTQAHLDLVKVDKEVFGTISLLKNLRRLELKNIRVTPVAYATVMNMGSLEALTLTHCVFAPIELSAVSDSPPHPNLITLHCFNVQVEGRGEQDGLRTILSRTRLRTLALAGSTNSAREVIYDILRYLLDHQLNNALIALTIPSNNPQLLFDFLSRTPTLERIVLTGLQPEPSSELIKLRPDALPRLRSFEGRQDWGQMFVRQRPIEELQFFSVTLPPWLTAVPIPTLRKLSITLNSVDSDSLHLLASISSNLRQLRIFVNKVEDDIFPATRENPIVQLLLNLPTIRELKFTSGSSTRNVPNFENLRQTEGTLVRELGEKCPDLELLSFHVDLVWVRLGKGEWEAKDWFMD